MVRFSQEANLQQLGGGRWQLLKKFPNFGACRRHVNRMLQEGRKITQVSLFYHDDGSGCMEIFFERDHLIAEAPFRSLIVMRETLKRWRSLGKPLVVQFQSNGIGGYKRADPKSWRW